MESSAERGCRFNAAPFPPGPRDGFFAEWPQAAGAEFVSAEKLCLYTNVSDAAQFAAPQCIAGIEFKQEFSRHRLARRRGRTIRQHPIGVTHWGTRGGFMNTNMATTLLQMTPARIHCCDGRPNKIDRPAPVAKHITPAPSARNNRIVDPYRIRA
ncbi:MAG TPA: hypothetical protein VH583_06865 [Vicinamibacterales bacterium]